ncbi:hypothetical protein SFR_0626 [Streptomyces sp. FR-008]|nr:hypothetical protein SFR_0626 [Streptomyces sp. FR-008]
MEATPADGPVRLAHRLNSSEMWGCWAGRRCVWGSDDGHTVSARPWFIHTQDKVRSIPVIDLGDSRKEV